MGAGTSEYAPSAEDVEAAAVDVARDHPAHVRIGRKQVGVEGTSSRSLLRAHRLTR